MTSVDAARLAGTLQRRWMVFIAVCFQPPRERVTREDIVA